MEDAGALPWGSPLPEKRGVEDTFGAVSPDTHHNSLAPDEMLPQAVITGGFGVTKDLMPCPPPPSLNDAIFALAAVPTAAAASAPEVPAVKAAAAAAPRAVRLSSRSKVAGKRNPPSVTKKRFACDVCGQRFNKPARLRRHKETHRDDRTMYACTFEGCNKRYTREDHLKRHMITHMGDKRYHCTVPGCGKSFFYRYHLRRHMAVHPAARHDSVDSTATSASASTVSSASNTSSTSSSGGCGDTAGSSSGGGGSGGSSDPHGMPHLPKRAPLTLDEELRRLAAASKGLVGADAAEVVPMNVQDMGLMGAPHDDDVIRALEDLQGSAVV